MFLTSFHSSLSFSTGEGKFKEEFASQGFKDPDGYFGDAAFTQNTTTEDIQTGKINKQSSDLDLE